MGKRLIYLLQINGDSLTTPEHSVVKSKGVGLKDGVSRFVKDTR
jgi:hypothetical protein